MSGDPVLAVALVRLFKRLVRATNKKNYNLMGVVIMKYVVFLVYQISYQIMFGICNFHGLTISNYLLFVILASFKIVQISLLLRF